MLLSKILENIDYTSPAFRDFEIEDIAYSSKNVKKNTLFTALKGACSDGHAYAASAYESGARAFLLEKDVPLPADAVKIFTQNTRAALAQASGNFFSHPSRELDVIGVTGTKGKTTVTHMLAACLNSCGIKSAVIGTAGAYYEDRYIPTVNSTPESYELQKLLRIMADAGCRTACIEVSSLGLKSHRTDGIRFSSAVFTNISPDHIGGAEHESFEEYAFWKKQLFKLCEKAFLNADDPFSEELSAGISVPVFSFALSSPADITACGLKPVRENGFFGVSFTCVYGGEGFDIKLPLPGFFNVYNALAAVGVCLSYGAGIEKIQAALEGVRIRGRAELISVPADFDVIVDYAHNGQSFKALFDTLSEYPHARLITVFGSVGGRAQLRRQEMGLISGKYSALSVITSDDPGFEEPLDICREIAAYTEKAGGKYKIITDRRQAVFYALSQAAAGDIVLVLGKGHETCQKIKGEKIYYSDRETVEEYFSMKI